MTEVALVHHRNEHSPTRPNSPALEVMFRFLDVDVRVESTSVRLLQHWAAVYCAFRIAPGPAVITVRTHGDADGSPIPGLVSFEWDGGQRTWNGNGSVVPPLATPPLDRWVYLRGAAVARAGQAVVLAGGAHVGKTLLAMSMVARGASLMTEGLSPLDPRDLLLAPFPKAVRLSRQVLSQIGIDPAHPALVPFRTRDGVVHWRADPRALFGSRSSRGAAEIGAVVFLHQAGRAFAPRLEALGQDEAYLCLRRHLYQRPVDMEAVDSSISRLCRQVPAYALTVGPPEATARLVEELLPS